MWRAADGRVGFRQLDAGNVIHASDQSPLHQEPAYLEAAE